MSFAIVLTIIGMPLRDQYHLCKTLQQWNFGASPILVHHSHSVSLASRSFLISDVLAHANLTMTALRCLEESVGESYAGKLTRSTAFMVYKGVLTLIHTVACCCKFDQIAKDGAAHAVVVSLIQAAHHHHTSSSIKRTRIFFCMLLTFLTVHLRNARVIRIMSQFNDH